MMWRPGVDHGRKHETGDETATPRGLTSDGPLRKHYLGTLPGKGGSSGQPQRGQQVEPRQSRSMSMRRTAGRVGWGGGPGEPASLFSPRPEPQVLEERERDHGHQRVPVQAGPGAAL